MGGSPGVAKKPSPWAPLAAALVVSLLYRGPLAGTPEGDTAAHRAFSPQKAYPLSRPLTERGEARAQPQRILIAGDRVAANPDAYPADEISVSSARTGDGEAIQVTVALAVPVDPDVVRAVLSDYENMPDFVPDIRSVSLVRVESGRKRVKIEGVARLLFMTFPIHTTLDVVLRPDGAIAIDSVAGNLGIRAVVRVQDAGAITRVRYQARLVPDFWVPPVIGDFLIGRQIRRQFEGMVAEMHRRANGPRGQEQIPDQSNPGGRLGRGTRLLADPAPRARLGSA